MANLSWPSFASSLLFAGATFLLCYAISTVLSYLRLRHVPGPTLWALTRLPLVRAHLKGDSYEKFGELSQAYGKLVRIGPNYLMASDPEVVRRMNAPRSHYTRSNWYTSFRFVPGVDSMISERDEKRHDMLRRKAAPAYSGKESKLLEKDIDQCILDLVYLIGDKYASTSSGEGGTQMELCRKAQFFTTDTISLLAFSSKFGNLKDDTDHFGYIQEVESIFPNMFCTCVLPELMEILTATGILSLFNPADNPKLAFGKVMRIAKAQIDSRLDAEGNFKGAYGDMMGSFIKHGMTPAEMEQESVLQL